jgi:ABC-type nitrate/sulfonate/bicarbonate transport system permease component
MRLPVREILAILFLFVVWHLLALLLNSPVVPTPYPVFLNFVHHDPGEFAGHFWASFLRIFNALVVALLAGAPLGILFGRSRLFNELTSPLIYLLYPTPKIVFLPVIIILLGLGDLSKVFIIFIIVFFQILVTTRDAARSIGDEEVLSVKSMGGRWTHVMRYVVIPSVLPNIFTSLRIAIGTCVAVLFFVESFATEKGLGYLIIDAWSKFDYILMFNGIILMGTLGLAFYVALSWLERYTCKWMFQ